jgi:hypothetical protein
MHSDTNTNAANAEHSLHHVHRGFNALRHIPRIVSNRPMADLLCRMWIGMLDHIRKWRFHFFKTEEWLDK